MQKLREERRYRRWRLGIYRLCRRFAERPMPGRLLPLQAVVLELVRDALVPAFDDTILRETELDFLQAALSQTARLLDLPLGRLATIDSPPARKKETVADLLTLKSPIGGK